MAKSNIEIVGNGLEILLENSIPYLIRELQATYQNQWWQDGVEPNFKHTSGLSVKEASGTYEERMRKTDIQFLISLLLGNWNKVFDAPLGGVTRNYVYELRDIRNNWAHQRGFSVDDAHRALDTMVRFLQATSNTGHEQIKALAQGLLRRRYEEETKKKLQEEATRTNIGVKSSLKPWREVVTPHRDVAAGRYQQAEFAADLFQVITNKAEREYQDPKEFFRRTYFTEGLLWLVQQAWLRLADKGGAPVVELKTNFGGGKTHSMLALYHLFSGLAAKDVADIDKVVPDNEEGRNIDIPKANRAVLVGTQISPVDGGIKPDGTQINTLWGELAWQLGNSAGDAKGAYGLVAEEDKQGVSPGSEKLTRLFEAYGPALILIDEWVAYARQIYGKNNLPCGNFDSNITFVQALTEAAKAAKGTIVVASLPASDIEKGGEYGEIALERIENVFSRVEARWKPASETESFEIVRRRLFQDIKYFADRDAVCRAFSEMYQENRGDFPQECRELDYEERMKSTYPVHPELFERLNQDWSTLDRFQLTRGVLRLMAGIIHELWERQDGSALIMPGTVPLYNAGVKAEIAEYLPMGWGGVLDRDVDGSLSRPLVLDRENPNLGRYSASRRVTRCIFIGSAPSVAGQRVRGIDELRIKLGCVQPGENVSSFGDALRRLTDELTYLYMDGGRYWFDTRPSIGKTANERAQRYLERGKMVEDEIIRRLHDSVRGKRGEFSGVHTDPKSSGDIPDEPMTRLVILGPEYPHRRQNGGSKALVYAEEILGQRGTVPRLYRNMVVFLVAESERLKELFQATSLWLAWTAIDQEKEQLNLDAAQMRQVTSSIKHFDDTIKARMLEAYNYLLVPTQEGTDPIALSQIRLQSGDHLVERASHRLVRDEELISKWSPATLKIELDKYLWKDVDHLNVKQLWDYLAQYVYLPRLKDENVLIEAVRQGAGSLTWQDYFGYASAVREDGYYIGLVAGFLPNVTLDSASVIVKPEKVKEQREREAIEQPTEGSEKYPQLTEDGAGLINDRGGTAVVEERETVIRRFHGSVDLNAARMGRDAGQIADEVLSHLSGLVGADVKISLEINVEVPDGIPENIIRIVKENANTLKFNSQGFEEY
jgi:uncharacterized protein